MHGTVGSRESLPVLPAIAYGEYGGSAKIPAARAGTRGVNIWLALADRDSLPKMTSRESLDPIGAAATTVVYALHWILLNLVDHEI